MATGRTANSSIVASEPEVRLTSNGPDSTRMLGKVLGSNLGPGQLILLRGPLGSGKTCLAQGIAKGLGVVDVVNSPTFVLATEYKGRIPFYHVDLYRLESLDHDTYQCLESYFDGTGVTVVEWPDLLPAELVHDAHRIRIAIIGATQREIAVHTSDPRLLGALQGLRRRWERGQEEAMTDRPDASEGSPGEKKDSLLSFPSGCLG